jgi:Fic family protein
VVRTGTGCREVSQHVVAFAFLHDHLVRDAQPLSQVLICEAHCILVSGLKGLKGVKAGITPYRTTPVNAGFHQFPHASCIHNSMHRLVQQYNELTRQQNKDPFVLATWLHPFTDGNGRMCRLLLNIALLAHGIPFCSALGMSSGHRQAKKHYIQCIKHSLSRSHNDRPPRLAFAHCRIVWISRHSGTN